MDNLSTALPPTRVEFDQLLGDEITLLAGQLNAGSYRLIKLIGRFDDCKAWHGGGSVPTCAPCMSKTGSCTFV